MTETVMDFVRKLFPASIEQQDIVEKVKLGCNLIVSAVAGSGKTTGILHLSDQILRAIILVITYNSKLKIETRDRVFATCLRAAVHSFHSVAVMYYSRECYTDEGITRVIQTDMKPRPNIPCCSIIVLDEAQDITLKLFTFFLKFLRDMLNKYSHMRPPQIVMIGDARQSIYKYRSSDERYLGLADKIFVNTVIDNNPWHKMPLSTSFRVTANMAQFVNTVMIRQKPDLIATVKPAGEPVVYLIGGPYKANYWIMDKIKELLKQGIAFDDIIILAPSVKNLSTRNDNDDGAEAKHQSPLALLVHMLGEAGVRVHITNDLGLESKATSDLAKGKLLITTFHQSKGIERKVVIVTSFDKTYFEYYNKKREGVERSVYVCPNEMYVACTRATELLILIAEQYEGDQLQFLDMACLDQLVERGVVVRKYLGDQNKFHFGKPLDQGPKGEKAQEVMVTRLTEWLPDTISTSIMTLLNLTLISKVDKSEHIHLPQTVTFSTHTEQVSELNGLAIPALLELKLGREVSMLTTLRAGLHSASGLSDVVLFAIHKRFTDFQTRVPQITSISHLLELACLQNALVSTLTHKLKQIEHYNWLDGLDCEACVAFLETLLVDASQTPLQDGHIPAELQQSTEATMAVTESAATPQFETVVKARHPRFPALTVEGQIDLTTASTVFEIKCVQELDSLHYIQLALYAWLWNSVRKDEPPRVFRLVNVTKGEVWQINPSSPSVLEDIASDVISQYLNPPTLNQRDDEFVLETQALVRRYIPLNAQGRAEAEELERNTAMFAAADQLVEQMLLTQSSSVSTKTTTSIDSGCEEDSAATAIIVNDGTDMLVSSPNKQPQQQTAPCTPPSLTACGAVSSVKRHLDALTFEKVNNSSATDPGEEVEETKRKLFKSEY